MSGGLDGVCEAFKTKGEAWRLHADFSKERADAVRKLTGWIRGVEPPPDGATRADALERGPAWSGWPWSIRREGGGEVSPALWNEEREAAADALADLAVKVATEAGKVSDAFHAEERLAALRGEVLTPPREWNSPLLEILRPARDAAEAALDALNEEGATWREWEAVCAEARRTLPLAEIEAARARLEAEKAAKVQPVRVEVAGLAAVVENTGAAALAAKQGAQEAKRTRKEIEQQGAAVVGAVREVGAKVGENGKAKPRGGKREKMPDWSETETDAFRSFARYATGEDFPDGRTQAVKDAGGWDGLYSKLVGWLPGENDATRKAFRRVKSGADLQRLRKAAIYRVNNPAK